MTTRYALIDFEANPTIKTVKPYVHMYDDYATLDRALANASRESIAILKIDAISGKTEQLMDASQIEDYLVEQERRWNEPQHNSDGTEVGAVVMRS